MVFVRTNLDKVYLVPRCHTEAYLLQRVYDWFRKHLLSVLRWAHDVVQV